MAKKLILGLAAVGGGVYLYDQNVQPILPRDNKGHVLGVPQAAPPKELKEDFHKLGQDTKELGAQIKKTVDGSVSDIRHKTDEAVSNLKDSDVYNKWSQKLDSYQKDVSTELEDINKKPLANKLAAKYINLVNSVGQTEDEKLKELASSTSSRQQEIKKDLSKNQQSWSSWWSGKKSEAEDKKDELASKAEKEKNSWFSWGQSKADEADAKLQKEKNSWVNWADEKSDDAKKAAEDAKKEKNKWVSWGSSKADEAEKAAKDASKDLESKKNEWVSWGSSKADEADKAAKDAQKDLEAKKNDWVSWGSAKADEAQKAAKDGEKDLKAALNDQSQQLSENFEYAKKKASEEYETAKKELENWTQQAKDKANGLWTKADEEHLKKAGDDFQSAFANLKRFGEELTSSK